MSSGNKIITRRPPGEAGNLPAELHPVLQRIYLARHVTTTQELGQSLDQLIPPAQLKGIDQATALLADALQRQRRMLIVADFDADGATSCALALRALRSLGARDVRYLVPNRFSALSSRSGGGSSQRSRKTSRARSPSSS